MPEKTEVTHHYPTTITLSVERNSRGYNWEATVANAPDVDTALALVTDAEAGLRTRFGPPVAGPGEAVEKAG